MSTPDFPDAAEIERRKALSPEARRALEEADARRIETAEDVADLPEDDPRRAMLNAMRAEADAARAAGSDEAGEETP